MNTKVIWQELVHDIEQTQHKKVSLVLDDVVDKKCIMFRE